MFIINLLNCVSISCLTILLLVTVVSHIY